MKKILTLVSIALITTTIQGCVAAGAVAAGGAQGTSVAKDKRSFDTMEDDQKISYQANKQIAADPQLSSKAHIVVASYNYVVLLAGQAPTPELRNKAVRIVQGIPKVKRIFNEITIGEPISAITRSQDALITGNVKARMVATTNLDASRVKVVTENGVVYIMGLTTRRQADIAAIVARNSSGVKRVVKLVEYTDLDDSTSATVQTGVTE